jgi:transposase
MEDLEAEAFLADKAYDTNELLDMLKEADIAAVIPPVKSRKEQRAYSHELYRARHVIENVFRALKRRRGIALRKAYRFLYRRHLCQVFIPLPSSPHYRRRVGHTFGRVSVSRPRYRESLYRPYRFRCAVQYAAAERVVFYIYVCPIRYAREPLCLLLRAAGLQSKSSSMPCLWAKI